MGVLVDRFDEHDGSLFFLGGYFVKINLTCLLGPVRAVAIHPTRALLVSGGDDYKIKVWGQSAFLIFFFSFFPQKLMGLFCIKRYQTSKPPMPIHTPRTPGLYSYCPIPSRDAMDREFRKKTTH